MNLVTKHDFVGEHPDHCFFVFDEGAGANDRRRFVYCGNPNEAPNHIPNQAMIAARGVIDFLNNRKYKTLLPEIAAVLETVDPSAIAGFHTVTKALEPLLETVAMFPSRTAESSNVE